MWKSVITVALCVGLVFTVYKHGEQYGKSQIQSLWDKEKQEQLQTENQKMKEWEAKFNKGMNDASKREAVLRSHIADAVSESHGLRQQLKVASSRATGATNEALVDYARTVNELFTDCTGKYQELAAKADGHAIDAVKLSDTWPE